MSAPALLLLAAMLLASWSAAVPPAAAEMCDIQCRPASGESRSAAYDSEAQSTGPMASYADDPVAHDDLGRSDEPDRAATGVLGPVLVNRVVDLVGAGVAVPDPPPLPGHAGVVAPGCSDNQGRLVSGLCGLFTVGAADLLPPGTVGASGMSGPAAPGAYSASKATAFRLLDARITAQTTGPGGRYLDVRHPLVDSSAAAVLGAASPELSGAGALAGLQGAWAWYGRWQDKNGNGVIDSLADFGAAQDGGPRPAADEFTWSGNCHRAAGGHNPKALASGYCALDAEAAAGGLTTMVGFLWPGTHHASCAGRADPLLLACPAMPADAPGREVVHLLAGAGVPVCGPLAGFSCAGDLQRGEAAEEGRHGDTLLGDQGSVAFDQAYADRTGEPRLAARQWAYGAGWLVLTYDQGVLTNLVHVTAAGCAPDGASAHRVRLATCRFTDVDTYRSLSPLTDALLQGAVRPAARGNWLLLRALAAPALAGVDGHANGKALATHDLEGPPDDRTWDPGFAREPNTLADAYPAATHAPCQGPDAALRTFRGWCNTYAHQAGPRAFGDLQPLRVAAAARPVAWGNTCALCAAGASTGLGYAGEAPAGSPLPVLRAAGDHARTLGPGSYLFRGAFGLWQDRAQAWTEAYLDLGPGSPALGQFRADAHAAAPDGWVGSIVHQTGTFAYRGYPPGDCTTDQGPGTKPYGACDPYLNGTLRDPQGLAPGAGAFGEFQGRCDAVSGDGTLARSGRVQVRPLDGVWHVPVFVWRDHAAAIDLRDPASLPLPGARLDDLTGSSGPAWLSASCSDGGRPGGVATRDLLVLPLGNRGEPLEVAVHVTVDNPPGPPEVVRDADAYAGWG